MASPEVFRPCVGDRVIVGKNLATVRFIGPTQFAGGDWIGCELDDQTGKNDGSVQGVQYFECKTNHGIFVREGMVKKPGAKKKRTPTVNGTSSTKVAADSAEVAELRMQLAEAAEEHDVERLRELLPRAEADGVSPKELENAQRVLTFQAQNQLLIELEDVREHVARLADVVATVEARAAAVERAVASRVEAEAGSKGEKSPGVEGLLFDNVLMDAWIKDFGSQLQERVWETLERDVEAALEKAVQKATHDLSELGLAPVPTPDTDRDLDTLRVRARDTLAAAEQSGSLEEILKRMAAEEASAASKSSCVRAQHIVVDADKSGEEDVPLQRHPGQAMAEINCTNVPDARIYKQATQNQAIGIEGCLLSAAVINMPTLLF